MRRRKTRVSRSVSGKVKRSDIVLRRSGERWCRRRSKNSECCACKVRLVRAKTGEMSRTLRRIIREDALDKLESECHMKVLQPQELWSLAVAQKDRKCVARCGSKRLSYSIGSSSLALCRPRSSSTTLSTKNITRRRVAAVVDDTTAVLDSCSLKQSSRAYHRHTMSEPTQPSTLTM